MRITGAQLRAYLEYSARYFRANADGSVGVDPTIPGYNFDVVAGRRLHDRPVEADRRAHHDARVQGPSRSSPTDTFTIALNNYRQTGGGGYAMLRDAPVVYDRQQEIRQLLIDEVRRKGTIAPADYFHPNWRIVPAAAVGQILKAPQ